MWIDAVAVCLLKVAEVATQRFLLVGAVDALGELSTVHPSTLVGEELERRPSRAVVGTLVERDGVIRSTRSAEM